ncbi:3' terminal RNA ribose 2'-O-methyltransferase Hen1 [Nocardioides zeae]|uniref:Small RNA 2'-O-methyltransferase n=1 Tax=Nocardioides zeae TaxID=1457234 RepID=A0AAJ1U1N9_9ACTN|nr:3' terminal RNA ribose 2'-O-methyltransferase Hen1 [Nocardioides zeae]MDQ1104280.1 3' terminal RNA ribose 2'-O-methyltransferase Hen1 [Nocardioides zeae]
MLLTVSTTHRPATDLGYLLFKHPDRVQEFEQSFGSATVFYPEATEERCTAALVLDVDPVRLVRSRPQGTPDFSLAQYVNDRPYAASSLLAVAIRRVFSTARSGRCDARPELAGTPIPLEVRLPAVPCRPGGETGRELLRRIFEPLGWEVDARDVPLDETIPDWGPSRYLDLTLRGRVVLADALNQLHVLLPALDQAKHYWQAPDEVEKLLRSGGDWLATHPERDLITRRYLGRRRALAREALARLEELDGRAAAEVEPETDESGRPEGQGKRARPPLNQLRREAVLGVLDELAAAGATSVVDLGCGGGQLLADVLARPAYAVVAGTDVSAVGVLATQRRLRVDERSLRRTPDRQAEALRARISVFQASVTYTDERFAGYDAAVLMEVVEHLDPERLPALERVVFGEARPGAVVVTTPNADHNVRYPGLTGFRHPDHRFEWSREEFAAWCDGVAARTGYTVERRWVGEVDPEVGAPTQMGVFRRG